MNTETKGVRLITGPDIRNPVVHMTLWHFIATGGLLLLLFLFNASTEAGQAKIFVDTGYFLLGAFFWLFVALVAGFLSGLMTGVLLWFATFTARVNEGSVIYYYLKIWLRIGAPLGIVYGLIAWWYLNSGQWAYFLWTDVPRPRDAILAVLWLVIVALIGATRFIDSLYVESRQMKKQTKK